MRRRVFSLLLLLLLQLCLCLPLALEPKDRNRASVQAAYATLPLSFELNEGQADRQIRFLSRAKGHGLYLSSTDALLTLPKREKRAPNARQNRLISSISPSRSPHRALRMKLLNADADARISGQERLPGKTNYILGNDPNHWRTNIPTYARVRYHEIYPGVDLVFYGNQGRLEYDFIIGPGAKSECIALEFEGADHISLDDAGNLLLHAGDEIVKQHRPLVYQEVEGVRQEVSGDYLLTGNQVRFKLSEYDPSLPLVIDPVLLLSYSTYLGGSGDDVATDIALDSSGNAYITGLTTSTNFPTRDPAQPNYGGGEIDAFIVKFNPAGTSLVYATYLGGNNEDQALGIAVDPSGSAYVTGQTCSPNFPTRNAVQAVFGGFCDAFVTKLNASGSSVGYSTYLGGRENDPGFAIAVDPSGNAYVTGWTASANFPTKNPFQPMLGDVSDAFVTKLNAAGSELIFSTFLGGNSGDFAHAVAVDSAGNAYVTGETRSSNFPTVNPLQPMKGGGGDAFVTKFNAAGSALVYSTYLGGSCETEGWGIAIDASGSAYVTGTTCSTNFPTVNPFQAQFGGGQFTRDAFVSKLNPAGTALVYSTYLGGSRNENDENQGAIAVDASGQAYVGGETSSTDFPLKSAWQSQRRGNSDFFITKFTAAGSAVVYSTYLGGSDEDGMFSGGMAVDAMGNVFVVGVTRSKDFPTTPGAFQPSPTSDPARSLDATITKIAAVSSASTTCVSAASYAPANLALDSIVAAFGTDLAVATQTAVVTPLPTNLAGTTVKIRDSVGKETLAPLFFVSNVQVNYLMPAEAATGPATVTITNADGFVSTGAIQVARVSPGLFAANSNGQGVTAAVALRVKADGAQSYEPVARWDATQKRFVSLPIDLGPTGEQVFLIVFGTGLRSRSALSAVIASLGGTPLTALYAGAQVDFAGLDQINLGPIPRNLAGRGEANLALTADGQAANVVTASLR
jgi:uncharacterized protein (TIGR03437 family)